MVTQVRYAKVKLKNLYERLKRYCHAKGCEYFDECPIRCRWCGMVLDEQPELGLDTAIAWNAADAIYDFTEMVDEFNDRLSRVHSKHIMLKLGRNTEHYLETMAYEVEQLREMFDEAVLIADTVSVSSAIVGYHHSKHQRLYSAIDQANKCMVIITMKLKRTVLDGENLLAEMKKKFG